MLKGIAASAGVSVAKVYKLETPNVVIEKKQGDPQAEIKKFDEALEKTKKDIEGVKEAFVETFPDNGSTDILAAMKAYKSIGFSGVIRPDHTPTMYGEDNDNPGYAVLGNLFTIGYIRGLMEGIDG